MGNPVAPALLAGACGWATAQDITGAGATFPAPSTPSGPTLQEGDRREHNYQSVGSGAGIEQIKAKTVDFGASDMPLTERSSRRTAWSSSRRDRRRRAGGQHRRRRGRASSSSPARARRHLPRQGQEVERPGDRALTPAWRCPTRDIAVRRSDGSGTTLQLHQLPVEGQPGLEGEGRRGYGCQLAGRHRRQGQRGCLGVRPAAANSIGYVEYAYAMQNKMALRPAEERGRQLGRPRRPTTSRPPPPAPTGTSTFHQVLTDQPGKDSWPISGATFIVMHKVQEKPANATAAEVLRLGVPEGRQDGRRPRVRAASQRSRRSCARPGTTSS